MKCATILFCLLLVSALRCQTTDIFNQNFKGVRSLTVWNSAIDSTGKTVKPKAKLYSYDLDSAGRILTKIRWSGFLKDSVIVFTYDSSGRLRSQKITHGSSEFYRFWTYEINAKTGATVRTMKQGQETVEVAAVWTDSLSKLRCESIWKGRIMAGNPSSRQCFNAAGKLVSASENNNEYREYKYDAAGNLERIIWRSFWKQTSAPPPSVYYENIYRNELLVSTQGPLSKVSFTYNTRGHITTQTTAHTANGDREIMEAVYTYY